MIRNTEAVIFDLKKLIKTQGYIYSLCLILVEDSYFDLNKIHEVDYRSKLSVKELSLIIGFLVQEEIDYTTPTTPENCIVLMEKTYELMRELQASFNAHLIPKFQEMMEQQNNGEKLEDTQQGRLDFFASDKGMVEPMFYAGNGVYDFQYLEYLESKYKYDSEWLLQNRQFDISKTKEIVSQIKETLQKKAQKVTKVNLKEIFPKIAKEARKKLKKQFPLDKIEEMERQQFIAATFYQYVKLFPVPTDINSDNSSGWNTFYKNLLNLFVFNSTDFENIEINAIDAFFRNFSFVPKCNESYEGPGHFNILNSRPLIKLEDDNYFIPINYLIAEAVYESPFYWMWDDRGYRDTLAEHRGNVGEEISYNFLSKVFGIDNTLRSVIIETKKGQPTTDIDVLCLLGNKALCVQVKSKKLTLTAKRGDFDQLKKDFNGAVQDAYNQGLLSREAILSKTARLLDRDGNQILLPNEIDEVYIVGLTTENYPSLVHQVQMMLTKDKSDPYPLVLSVFDLELLAHYLNDPYDFLYYVRQRIDLVEYFRADEELIYLGYHLERKLWRVDSYGWGMLDNSFGAIIDRNYYPHKTGLAHLLSDSDDPLLNRWKDPQFDLFIKQIKLFKHPKTTDIIFHLLDWSGNSRKDFVNRMTKIKELSQSERTSKSLALPSPPNFGVSYIVLPQFNPSELSKKTIVYADLRKYISKCNAWLGIGTFADSPNLIDFFIYNDEVWMFDRELEDEFGDTLTKMRKTPFTPMSGKKKVGRNDPCPCNSGKKYKKCCGS